MREPAEQGTNPYQASLAPADDASAAGNARVAKRVDSLYRNVKMMPVLTALGLFVPLMLMLAVPLALVYLFLRRQLLEGIDRGAIVIDPNHAAAEQVAYLREHSLRLWAPLYVAGVWIALFTVIFGSIALGI